jgi:hypothetical protein
MGWASSIYGQMERRTQSFGEENLRGKRPFVGPRHRWEGNMKDTSLGSGMECVE